MKNLYLLLGVFICSCSDNYSGKTAPGPNMPEQASSSNYTTLKINEPSIEQGEEVGSGEIGSDAVKSSYLNEEDIGGGLVIKNGREGEINTDSGPVDMVNPDEEEDHYLAKSDRPHEEKDLNSDERRKTKFGKFVKDDKNSNKYLSHSNIASLSTLDLSFDCGYDSFLLGFQPADEQALGQDLKVPLAYTCAQLSNAKEQLRKEECTYFEDINEWQESFKFTCPAQYYIESVYAYESPLFADKKFSFSCCKLAVQKVEEDSHNDIAICHVAELEIGTSQVITEIPNGTLIKGIKSSFNQAKGKRELSYQYCSPMFPEIDLTSGF